MRPRHRTSRRPHVVWGPLRQALMTLSRLVLARPAMQRVSQVLFHMALRGMGILNYRDDKESGEAWLLHRLGMAARSGSARPVLVDVGANEGNYAVRALASIPQVHIHAFEPHPQTVARLQRRLAGTVTVVPAAAGSAEGNVTLYDYTSGEGSAHASPYREVVEEIHGRPSSSVTVPVRRLDDYLEEVGSPRVLLLKVDTEGHELDVLRGSIRALERSLIDVIQFEFNEMNVISRVFLRDIAQILPDFEMFRLLPRGVTPLRGEPLEEIFAFQNIVAVRRSSSVSKLFP